jgi:surfactin synthase thioesterase subunit
MPSSGGVDPDVFKSWFPASSERLSKPLLRVLCFANAGGSENTYTGPVIKAGKRNANRLMQWASENQVEVLAPQLPGRESRRKEPALDSCVGAARALLPIITPEVSDGVPYVIVAHSVGCWVAYELVRLLKQHSLPQPVHSFLSSFPAPDMPVAERPWTANGGGTLADKKFQDECRGWDVNDVVFSEQMWGVYGGLLRADFGLFDTYKPEGADKSMGTSITVFYASSDKKITEAHVRGWERFSGEGTFSVSSIEGNHMFVSNQGQKAAWFDTVATQLDQVLAQSRPAPHLIPISHDDFKKWFPACSTAASGTSNARSAAGIRRVAQPRMRLICIPNAGSSENVFTAPVIEGGKRRPNSLMDWAEGARAEVLAVQLPGRELRRKENYLPSPRAVAAKLLPLIAREVAGNSEGGGGTVPYVIVAHSVGCWVAYELVRLLKQHSLPLPMHSFLSSFPAPDMPVAERPWTANGGGTLADKEFQDECRGWDVNDVVFSEQMWGVYGGLLRADFGLFDAYEFDSGDDKSMGSSISAFYASSDKKITEAHVRGWERFSRGGKGGSKGEFSVSSIEGNHMVVSNQGQKAAWFKVSGRCSHIVGSARVWHDRSIVANQLLSIVYCYVCCCAVGVRHSAGEA